MLKPLLYISLASLVFTACAERRVAVPAIREEAPAVITDVTGAIVETFAESLTVVAGTQVTIRCIVSRDREHLEGSPVGLSVSPEIGDIAVDGFTATFTPTSIGDYRVNCFVPESDIRDEVGITVRVKPAAVARVDTELDAQSAAAGAYVNGRCLLYDEFDNPVTFSDLGSDAQDPILVMHESIRIQDQNELNYTIQGTTAGDHTVACQYGTALDETPVPFKVVPGPPSKTETFINPTVVAATEEVTVSCSVYDAYNNQLPGVATAYQVMPANGSQPSQNGLVQNPNQFTVAQRGEYFVYCVVPEYSAADETPAIATVTAGNPFHWEVEVSQQNCYLEDVAFPVTYDVVDRWGNVIANPQVDVAVEPSSGFIITDTGAIIFSEEGDYDISFSLGGTLDPAGDLQPVQLNVRVDSTPPQFNFSSPARGEMVEEGTVEDTLVEVSGTIFDGLSPIAIASVSGQSIEVGGDELSESFVVNTNSRWGMTTVAGYAEDECGNRQNSAHSFLRSPSYLEPALVASSGARTQTAVLAHLNQMTLDDGYRIDMDDLATIAQGLFSTIDLNSQIPDLLVITEPNDGNGDLTTVTYTCDGVQTSRKSTGLWVKKNGSITLGNPVFNGAACDGQEQGQPCTFVEAGRDRTGVCKPDGDGLTCDGTIVPRVDYLKAIDDGVKLKATIEKIYVPLEIFANVDLECSEPIQENLTGAVTIERVVVDATASASFANQTPTVSFCDTCISIDFEDLELDFNWDNLSFLDGVDNLSSALNSVTGVLEEPVESLLASMVQEQIAPLIADFLTNVSITETIELPAPLSISLGMDAGLDYFKFSGPEDAGSAALGLYTQIIPGARGSSIAVDSKGAITRPNTMPLFSPAYAFGVGLSDNLLNQVFWGLWYAGALSIDDLDALDFDADLGGIEFSFEATLPPVLMPGRNGNEVELGLGDAKITASVDLSEALGGESSGDGNNLDIELYLSTIIGAEVNRAEVGDGLRLVFDEYPEVWIQVTQINSSGYQAQMTDLFTALMRLIVPRLLGDALSSIDLPTLDLSGQFSESDELEMFEELGLGPGKVWELKADSASRSNDYYRITGGLQ